MIGSLVVACEYAASFKSCILSFILFRFTHLKKNEKTFQYSYMCVTALTQQVI